jgi:hypothetical protein
MDMTERTFDEMTEAEAHELAKNDPIEWVKTAMRTDGYDCASDYSYSYRGMKTHHGMYIKLVNSVGGTEGGGEYAERTFAVRNVIGDTDVFYFEMAGSYDSYEGTEWDDIYLVTPVQVMVTQYHAI